MIKAKPKRTTRRYIPTPKPRGNISAYYAMLLQGGIILRIENDELVIDALENKISPILKNAVEKRKAALLAHLRSLPK